MAGGGKRAAPDPPPETERNTRPNSAAGPSVAAGPGSAAGPSSAPGPGSAAGPSSAVGPSSAAGPSNLAGPSSSPHNIAGPSTYHIAQRAVILRLQPPLRRFYIEDNLEQPWQEVNVLPNLWRALDALPTPAPNGTRARSGIIEKRLWDGSADPVASTNIVLGAIADLLIGDALLETSDPRRICLPKWRAFHKPLINTLLNPITHPSHGICMHFDREKAHETNHFDIDGHGYLNVRLAYDNLRDEERVDGSRRGHHGVISIGAHAFITWAFFGPPNPSFIRPGVMHFCGNKTCLQPLHMVWGPQSENLQDALHQGQNTNARSRIVSRIAAANHIRAAEEGARNL